MIGTRVGSFRIVRELGRGGMAVVYAAERVEGGFEQRAAVKVIQAGVATEDVLRRFEQERQILATLEHAAIARVYEGGATADGRPYLAMEQVDGRPINRYCDEERLPIEERLRLFVSVARAVAHAHRRLVV
ncbi:MAG: protein kinase, partial [Acidobacteriota bacterium]